MTVPDAPAAAGQAEAGALEIRLGLVFKDRRLLLGALTHGSYRNEFGGVDLPDNERLEYLGDAVVDFLAAGLLFRRLPEAREGELTALRAALVCEASLARFARQLDLGASLRLGRGEAASGGRERSTLLCDAFESVIGALYLDSGLAAAAPVVEGLLSPALDLVLAERGGQDVKSSFQELAQRRWQTANAGNMSRWRPVDRITRVPSSSRRALPTRSGDGAAGAARRGRPGRRPRRRWPGRR